MDQNELIKYRGSYSVEELAQILKEKNEHVIVLNQFENQANIEAHTLTTATEILTDTKGEIDALVAGVGTAGTLIGTARALKTCIPDLQVIAVEPKSSPVLSQGITGPHKILGIGPNFIPPFYDKELVDEVISVSNEDALNGAEMSAKLEGLAVGISAGAALKAAITVAKRVEMANKNIVVILPDSIERYLSMGYFGI